MIQPEKVQQAKVSRRDCFNYLFLCKRYDGIDT